MARPVPSGTPDRPTRYLPLRGRGRLVLASLVAPIVILVAVLGVYSAGYREVAAPAPVVLRHAPIQGTCEECHRSTFPHTASELRCERCHDPRVTWRLGVDAHASWNPPSRQLAGPTAHVTCATCHTEHRGRLASLRDVEPLECARCHQFTGLERHPQFAMVQAGRNPGRGLRFSHARHLDEVRRTLGRGCEACHRSTADLAGFEPTSFDRQCAVCHAEGGVLPAMTDPVAEDLVTLPPSARAAAGATGGYGVRRPGRGRLVVSGLTHRDPWVLQNLRSLSRGLYTAADVEARVALETRMGELERARSGALADAATADLQQRIVELHDRPPDGGSEAPDAGTSGGAPRSQRVLDRLVLELERRLSGRAAPISLAATLSDERALESALAAARARLTTLTDRLATPAASPDERARRTEAIFSIVSPCLTCHQLQDGRALAPVTAGARRLVHARFTHAPHVIQVGCETCHDAIAGSATTTDVNIPGIDTCRACHATGQAPSGCVACHRYHPSPDVGFGRAEFAYR
jgi:hypothetical protein